MVYKSIIELTNGVSLLPIFNKFYQFSDVWCMMDWDMVRHCLSGVCLVVSPRRHWHNSTSSLLFGALHRDAIYRAIKESLKDKGVT